MTSHSDYRDDKIGTLLGLMVDNSPHPYIDRDTTIDYLPIQLIETMIEALSTNGGNK